MSEIGVYSRALLALRWESPAEKSAAVTALYADWVAGEVKREKRAEPVVSLPVPGRPVLPELVQPRDLRHRKLTTAEGRAGLIHAISHIEFNAINLALDAVYRFRDVPDDYVDDWLQVASEEAYHFSLLTQRLQELGYQYGDFPAHNGLWEMALKTEGNVMHRMALVPRVLEARGLDVTPPMMKKLESVGERRSVEILRIILRDEIGHVRIGNRWYHWACEREGCEPLTTFRYLIKTYMNNNLGRGFNYEARLEAGFTKEELRALEKSLDQ